MAISVFTHLDECTPPPTQVSLYYNGVNMTNTTQGDLGVYFTEDVTLGLGDIINIPTQCTQGIDIVFVVDYTGSMGVSIEGVKAGISNILSTISAESQNNARIGLVLFDEMTGSATNYSNTSTYINLPAGQKFQNVNSSAGKVQHITAISPMGAVNNFTDFQAKLALLNTENFPLGNGQGTPEPGDMGVYEVVKNNLAGAWRAEAVKVVILITDAVPGGNDDANTTADLSYATNTLIPVLNSKEVQIMVQSTKSVSVTGNYYVNLTTQTTIPGRYDQVTFDSLGNWINTGLIAGIQALCDQTYYATCDLASTGWYHRAGDWYSFYFDANAGVVTNIYYFPATYDVTPSTYSTDENGRTITWTVNTNYVANGTTLYWSFNPTGGVSSSDFINAISSGSFTINNGVGSFQLTTRADSLTEGNEMVSVRIRTGSVSGTIVATSDFTLIEDTSLNVPTATPVPISVYAHYSVQGDGNGMLTSTQYSCGELTWAAFYSLKGSVLGFQVGDQVWSNFNRTASFNGNGYWYQVADMSSSYPQKVIRIGEGTIMAVENCPVVTPTPTATRVVPTATPVPNPTPTATAVSSGGGAGTAYCRNIWINGRVDTSRYGLQYIDTNGTTQRVRFNALLGTSYIYAGTEGVVYSVCAQQVPGTWDFTLSALVTLNSSDRVDFANGGTCTSNVDCFWDAPSSPTPTPTTQTEWIYLMDPCDGVSPYVVAKTNSPKTIGDVYDLTGSFYVDTNPYTIIALSNEMWETTIADLTVCPGGTSGGDKCLLAGTMIALADGTQKAIETITVGDELKSMVVGDMPDSDNYEVLKLWSQTNPTLSNTTTIVQNNTMSTVDSVLSFNGGRLTSSKDHLHIIKRSGNWIIIKASLIVVGDTFVDQNGSDVVITSIQELAGGFNVYKLDVEVSDTYFANGIITHNLKPIP